MRKIVIASAWWNIGLGALLLCQLGEGRPAREHEAEPHAPGDADRALGGAGEEERRVRLLHRMREDLVGAVDLEVEVLALVAGALLLEEWRRRSFP